MAAKIKRVRTPSGELLPSFTPLDDPRWIAAGQAGHMLPGDPVIGLEFDGAGWALPWWLMMNHHLANLDLHGRAVCVVACAVCSSAAAFDPVIGGRRHHFRIDGLHNGTIMPMDAETGSLWTGVTGEAIEGPLKGRVMPRLQSFQSTWQEWRAQHPATLVAGGTAEQRLAVNSRHAPGGPMLATKFTETLQHVDTRLPHYELVLGVAAGEDSRCYRLAALDKGARVLNDTLGAESIAVFYLPGSWMAGVYLARVDGQSLRFATTAGRIVDEQTGSTWEMSGLASAGPLKGRRLQYLHSGVQEFFIWAAFHPGTQIHGWTAADTASAPRRWSVDAMPVPVRRMLRAQGWPRGGSLLSIGCEDGLVAAWLAESGLDVVAIDRTPESIARAREGFSRIAGLKFEVMDIGRPLVFERKFDGLLDHGCLARLAPGERAAYAANLAGAANPGARFLLLLPAPKATLAALALRVRNLFQGSFDLKNARAAVLPHPDTRAPRDGAAFVLVRR